jgi:hypothetical protein
MMSTTFIATEDYSSDDQSLPITTMKSEPTFEYQAAHPFGMDAAGALNHHAPLDH